MQPVMRIEDQKELMDLLNWWKEKLGLQDWIIRSRLEDYNGNVLNSKNMGLCESDQVNKCAFIYIAKYETLPDNSIMTICMENILVHELLHCIFPMIINDSYEGVHLHNVEHQRLERMAKTLIMVKYNLDFDFYDYRKLMKRGEE